MGKNSGGANTAGLEQAAAESNALQKQMYEQGREDFQPWYNTGAAGIGKLSDLLGIGGGSMQSREQIYDGLQNQYTTQTQATPSDSMIFIGEDGKINTAKGFANEFTETSNQYGRGRSIYDVMDDPDKLREVMKSYGYEPSGGYSGGEDVIDYAGLNAATDAQFGAQTTPDDYGSLLQSFGMDQFEEDPSYQFRQEEANKALQRSMAAQGSTLGGGGYGEINPQVAAALQEQNQNLASTEYGNAYNRYNTDQGNKFNMLMGVSGLGAGVAGQQVQAGANYANQVGQTNTSLASAQMNAQMANNSQPSMFSSLLGAGAQLGGAFLTGGGSLAASGAGGLSSGALALGGFSDIRLKENIKLVDVQQGHNIYEFNYRDGSDKYRGVMAHEVQKTEPDAVMKMSNGYLAVDYNKIGLQMERV